MPETSISSYSLPIEEQVVAGVEATLCEPLPPEVGAEGDPFGAARFSGGLVLVPDAENGFSHASAGLSIWETMIATGMADVSQLCDAM
jgi:hypothetical protein